MKSAEQRLSISCDFAKYLAAQTGIERFVLNSSRQPGTYIVATPDERMKLFKETSVIWPS